MNFPENIRYSEDHEWIRVLDDGKAEIGISDFAQSELGDIVFVDIPEVGIELAKGEVFGSIEAVKTVSDLILPVSGELLEVNPLLEEKPETINGDPYNAGWIVRISLKDPKEVEALMDAAQYKKFIEK
jgi:glycine cleavage system H protein